MEPIEQQPLVQHENNATQDFGESEYGDRLQYKSAPPYRDIVFAIVFIVHLIIIICVGFILWTSRYEYIENNSNNLWDSDVSATAIFIGVLVISLCGIFIALLWLVIMRRYASSIIKTMLFLNIATWIAVTIIGVIVGEITLIIIGAICAVIYILWTWCIWRNIPFSSALLSISSRITAKYGNASIILSLAVILFDVLWIFLWVSAFSVYLLVESDPSSFVIFLFVFSLYWTFQVNQNISHTTTCGVAATWYFTTDIELNEFNPTWPAFKRTMTTSFGSVCFGSLIVAFLQALRAMIRTSQNRGHELLQCVCLCLLNCIESIVRWFNKYAFAHVAIYGTSYVNSAKNTWNLFQSQGILALINDDLTELAVVGGALIAACLCSLIGYFIGLVFSSEAAVGLAIYGFFIGFILCFTVLYTVHSAIICLFVCYAEEPAVMQSNHVHDFNRITNAKPGFASINQNASQQNQSFQQNL